MQFEIRAFEAGDLPRVHEIRSAAFAPVFASFRGIVGEKIAPIAFAKAEAEQGAHLDAMCNGDGHQVFVAVAGDEIAGFVGVACDTDSKVGEIDLNAVHPDFQGKGLGEKLYDHALNVMRKAGMRIATVGTGGDASHAPARRAYEKVGFGPSLPSVWMYRTL